MNPTRSLPRHFDCISMAPAQFAGAFSLVYCHFTYYAGPTSRANWHDPLFLLRCTTNDRCRSLPRCVLWKQPTWISIITRPDQGKLSNTFLSLSNCANG